MINRIDDNHGYYYKNQVPSSTTVSPSKVSVIKKPVPHVNKVSSNMPKADVLELSESYKAFLSKADKTNSNTSQLNDNQTASLSTSDYSETLADMTNGKNISQTENQPLTGYQKQGLKIYMQQAINITTPVETSNVMGIA